MSSFIDKMKRFEENGKSKGGGFRSGKKARIMKGKARTMEYAEIRMLM